MKTKEVIEELIQGANAQFKKEQLDNKPSKIISKLYAEIRAAVEKNNSLKGTNLDNFIYLDRTHLDKLSLTAEMLSKLFPSLFLELLSCTYKDGKLVELKIKYNHFLVMSNFYRADENQRKKKWDES
jgi:hypothetical protein